MAWPSLSTSTIVQKMSFDERARQLECALRSMASSDAAKESARLSGFRPEMVDWICETQLQQDFASSLVELRDEIEQRFSGWRAHDAVFVILAGNIWSGALQGVILPLCLGSVVLVKTSSADASFVESLRCALIRESEEWASALRIWRVSRDEIDWPSLPSAIGAVIAYGGAQTMNELRELVPAKAALIEHGHGVGAAVIDAKDDALVAAKAVAEDIAAFDQLGCLSPHWVVSIGSFARAQEVAKALFAALDEIGNLLPRASLNDQEVMQERSWRAVATLSGELHAGRDFAVSIEDACLRLGPGFRNVAVVPVVDSDSLVKILEPWRENLKVVGVSTNRQAELSRKFSNVRIVELGEMQKPPFGCKWDGKAAWHGLISVDDKVCFDIDFK